MIERWEVFRQEREKTEIQNRIINLKKAMIKVWLYHQSAHRLYFDIFSKFSKLKAAKLLEFKERYYGRMLNNRFKSHLIKLGRYFRTFFASALTFGIGIWNRETGIELDTDLWWWESASKPLKAEKSTTLLKTSLKERKRQNDALKFL